MKPDLTAQAHRRTRRMVDWAIFCAGSLSLVMAVGLTLAGALLHR